MKNGILFAVFFGILSVVLVGFLMKERHTNTKLLKELTKAKDKAEHQRLLAFSYSREAKKNENVLLDYKNNMKGTNAEVDSIMAEEEKEGRLLLEKQKMEAELNNAMKNNAYWISVMEEQQQKNKLEKEKLRKMIIKIQNEGMNEILKSQSQTDIAWKEVELLNRRLRMLQDTLAVYRSDAP